MASRICTTGVKARTWIGLGIYSGHREVNMDCENCNIPVVIVDKNIVREGVPSVELVTMCSACGKVYDASH